MSPKTMQKALSVALRLAAAPAMVACSAPRAPAPEAPASPTASATEPVPTSTRSSSGPSATTEDCSAIVAAAVQAKLGDRASGSSWFNPSLARVVDDPAAVACCAQLAEAKVGKTQAYREMQCCHVDVAPGSFCTPWGPPMPPSMA